MVSFSFERIIVLHSFILLLRLSVVVIQELIPAVKGGTSDYNQLISPQLRTIHRDQLTSGCFWSTRRKPTKTQGENGNYTERPRAEDQTYCCSLFAPILFQSIFTERWINKI